jgi:hypothetical protein
MYPGRWVSCFSGAVIVLLDYLRRGAVESSKLMVHHAVMGYEKVHSVVS